MERPVHWEHWGHKKTGHIGPVHLFKITFFILFVLYLFNCLPIKITGISIGCLKKWDRLYWYPPPVPINVLVKITQPTRYATSLLFSKKSHIENK